MSSSFIPPYINGRFVSIQKPEWSYQATNPAKPNEVLAQLGWRKDLVEDIVSGMKKAQAEFNRKDLASRLAMVEKLTACLRENAEEIKSQMILELGRSRFAVEEEWRLCERMFSALPKFCTELLSEKEEREGWSWSYAPVGLVLVSTNVALPMYTLLTATLPALVAGNAVALRPSMHCPLSVSVLASCVHQAELPAGLVQIVYGDLEVFRRLALTHQFDTVYYTGSEESAEQLRHDLWSHQSTKLVISGAGKNAAIVMDSCNIDDAVAKIVYGACVDCGQRVEATSLAFVHKKIAQEFSDKLVAAIKALPISAKEDLSHQNVHFMGPLCGTAARERFLRFQGIAARESEETLRWGKSIDSPSNGYFVSPGVHLMDAAKVTKSVYASNAFFGPDIAIVPFDSLEQATTILNQLNVSRAVSVHTTFAEEVKSARRLLTAPTLLWNAPTTDIEPGLPALGRGHAGNGLEIGMRFVLSTVYPQTASLKEGLTNQISLFSNVLVTLLALLCSFFATQSGFADSYEKAVEGNEVVKSKLYPRAGRFQLNVPQGGLVLNSSFVNTYFVNGGMTYHFNEWHALNIGVFYGINSDRDERKCVENFYFETKEASKEDVRQGLAGNETCSDDPNKDPRAGATAETPNSAAKKGPYHRKPAYMPIREISMMFDVNYQYTPVYGKALWFLSSVGYLDLYGTVGAGLAMSKYYPLKTTTNSGRDIKNEGTDNLNETGIAGRPPAEQQTSPLFSLGVGNRFFFAKHFLVNLEVRNFTILSSTTSNFYTFTGGTGVMF